MFKLYLIPVLKSSPSTETVISNKEVAVKSTSKPQSTPKNIVLGKTTSLPDSTDSQDVSNDFYLFTVHATQNH